MRKKISPVVAIVLVLVALVGVGLFGMMVMKNASHEDKIIVQPGDPKQTKPDPKVGVDSSGT